MAKYDFSQPVTEDMTLTGQWSCGYDPENPTIDGVKKALDEGDLDAFPVGTEVPDEYNGQSNPLIVVAQRVIEKDGQRYNAVYLQRSFVTDKGQQWATNNNNNYETSAINTFLNGDYLSRCSKQVQDIISEVEVPVVISSGATTVNVKWFLPSLEEVYGDASASSSPGVGNEGSYFDYWKTQTGLAAPSNNANAGRSVPSDPESGWWLRSRSSTTIYLTYYVNTNGSITTASVTSTAVGILPVCVIVASEPLPEPSTPSSLENLRDLLDEGKEIKIGSVIDDTYNGQSNPLIVVAQREVENSDGQKLQGVYLQRTYTTDVGQYWNSSNNNIDYRDSLVNTFLNGTYLSRCSDALQNVVAEVKFPVVIQAGPTTVSAKWVCPSIEEVYGQADATDAPGYGLEGEFFPYWKEKTGLASPSNAINAGRAIRDSNDGRRNWWLRTRVVKGASPTFFAWMVREDGACVTTAGVDSSYVSVLPVCVVTQTPPPSELSLFKEALVDGTAKDKYPVGTEIEDTYDGEDDPLIVAQYLDSSNNSSYGGAEGAILQRKYITNVGQLWNPTRDNNAGYDTSAVKDFLGSSYYNNCSEQVRSVISNINIVAVTTSGSATITTKWFLPSLEEVYGAPTSTTGGGLEGEPFDYWKNKTGLNTPSNDNNPGRIVKVLSDSGENGYWWLRTRVANGVEGVTNTGLIGVHYVDNPGLGVLPCCFISSKPYDALTPTLDNLKKALEAGDETTYPVGTEIPDTYNGQNNPLIVVKYLDGADSTYQDTNGNNVTGVLVQRRYVSEVGQAYNTSNNYDNSQVNTFLNSTYITRCSQALQDMLTEVKVPVLVSAGLVTVNSKAFLPCLAEMYGDVNASGGPGANKEGDYLQYWKDKTGLSSPSNSANSGRIVTDTTLTPRPYWTRTKGNGSTSFVWVVTTTGLITSGADGALNNQNTGILPLHVISNITPPVEPKSLAELKQALQDGETIKVGTEIPDEWGGQSNPLIVAQQLDSSNNYSYGGAEGVILIRKYVDTTWQFNTTQTVKYYSDSEIQTFLNGQYLDSCSDALKGAISDINIPWFNGSSTTSVLSKWFPMSAYEVCGVTTYGVDEGIMFQYWKDQTGLSSPKNGAYSGRIVRYSNGTAQQTWLRSCDSASNNNVCVLTPTGTIYASLPDNKFGVLPACFISKN